MTLPHVLTIFLRARRLLPDIKKFENGHTLSHKIQTYTIPSVVGLPSLLCFNDDEQFGKHDVRKIIEAIQTIDFQWSCLYLLFNMSSQAVSMANTICNVEALSPDWFRFDRCEHMSVPKYQILTAEETVAMTTRYGITTDQLPVLKKDDPICKFLGLKPSSVVYAVDRDLYRFIR